MPVSAADISTVVALLDRDSSGAIDFNEFVNEFMLSSVKKSSRPERIQPGKRSTVQVTEPQQSYTGMPGLSVKAVLDVVRQKVYEASTCKEALLISSPGH